MDAPEMQAPLAPYLAVSDAKCAITFYQQAFGAEVTLGPLEMPGGLVGHAELTIGNATIMLADGGIPGELVQTPDEVGACTSQFHLYVEDAGKTLADALAAGADLVRPLELAFDGRRSCKIRDPFGHNWFLSTVEERISPAEVTRRFSSLTAQ